jgi:hypothetical protein
MTTTTTQKFALAFSVSLFCVATNVTTLARVSWVNENQLYSSTTGLVVHECPELMETPIHPLGSIIPATFNPGPRVNAFEIFKSKSTLRAFSQDYEFLRDLVVNISLKTSLFPRELFQPTFGTLGSHRLKYSSSVSVPDSVVFDFGRRHSFSIARDCDVVDPEVHAQGIFGFIGVRFFDVTAGVQEPLTSTEDEVRFSLLALKEPSLSWTTGVRDLDSPESQDPDGNFFTFRKVRQDTRIVGQGSISTELSLGFLIQFISVRDFSYQSDRDLRTQTKLFPNPLVYSMVQSKLLEKFFVPSYFANLVTSNVNPFQREL